MTQHRAAPRGAENKQRPETLHDRMPVFAELLAGESVSLSAESMHAMCWWDEALSPALGTRVGPGIWERTPGGPRCAEAARIMDAWSAEGLWLRDDDSPELSGRMLASEPLLRRGAALSGAEGRMPWTPDEGCSPWYRMMSGIAQELGDAGLSGFDPRRDIIRLLLSDPVYTDDPWETSGGPGRVERRPPGGSGFPRDFRGSSAVFAVSVWQRPPSPAATSADIRQAARMWIRFLRSRASDLFPDFGERRFLAWQQRLTCVERETAPGRTEAVFLDGRFQAGRACWKKESQEPRSPARLLCIEVEPSRRGIGIGTYILRHACARGCALACVPPACAEKLWGMHGRPLPDGSWALAQAAWPLCRTGSAPRS